MRRLIDFMLDFILGGIVGVIVGFLSGLYMIFKMDSEQFSRLKETFIEKIGGLLTGHEWFYYRWKPYSGNRKTQYRSYHSFVEPKTYKTERIVKPSQNIDTFSYDSRGDADDMRNKILDTIQSFGCCSVDDYIEFYRDYCSDLNIFLRGGSTTFSDSTIGWDENDIIGIENAHIINIYRLTGPYEIRLPKPHKIDI